MTRSLWTTPLFAHRTRHAGVLLGLATCLGLALPVPTCAAGEWPVRPVTFIVAAGAGSSVDVFARVLGERLQAALGQSFSFDPRPAANGTIATQLVARAKPDGYTFLFAGNSALVINPLMNRNVPFDIEKDFVAVAPVSYVPLALAVASEHPARTSSS